MTPLIEIRPAKDWQDYIQCEDVQRDAWQMPDEREIVPAHLLVTLQKNGGLVLCAFDQSRVVGFVFGFLGSEGEGEFRRIKHCSHQLGVVPEYRSRGLGAELKEKQREYLIAQNIELATWTYDPLQAVNARLNISRLGAIARRYIRDAYGELADALNAGVATDRFEVEWWLLSERVQRKIARAPREEDEFSAAPVYDVEFDENGLPHVVREYELDDEAHRLEIPADINRLKARDLGLAQAWRQQTRASFERAFARGLSAVEVELWTDSAGRARAAYILRRKVAGL